MACFRWMLCCCLVAGCQDAEGDAEASECRCFVGTNTTVEALCDPGFDCGVAELTCPGESGFGHCDRANAVVTNPQVLDCALDLLERGARGTFSYDQTLDLGQRSGAFYTDGARAFIYDFESYDIGYTLSPVNAGPLRSREAIAACGAGDGIEVLECLWSAIERVENTCTRACQDGICEGDEAS